MGLFNSGNDFLYLKRAEGGKSPFKYLYFHINDEEGADFCAYFPTFDSNDPTIYRLTKMDTPQVITEEINRLNESDFLSVDDTNEHFWEKVKHKEEMIINSWKLKLKKTRERIVETNKNYTHPHFKNKLRVKK